MASTGKALAAVHAQCLAGDPAGPGRGKEQRGMGDFLRRAVTSERDLCQGGGIEGWLLALAPVPQAIGEFDGAGGDRVDADALFGQRQRLRGGVLAERGLDCGIWRTVPAWVERGDGTGVHDAGVRRPCQMRQRCARGAHGGHQVDVETGEPAVVVVIEAVAAGVVHQHVDTAQRCGGRFDPGVDGSRVGQVAALHVGAAATRGDLVRHFVQRGLPACANGYGRSRRSEGQRDAAADALAAAGDGDVVAGQAKGDGKRVRHGWLQRGVPFLSLSRGRIASKSGVRRPCMSVAACVGRCRRCAWAATVPFDLHARRPRSGRMVERRRNFDIVRVPGCTGTMVPATSFPRKACRRRALGTCSRSIHQPRIVRPILTVIPARRFSTAEGAGQAGSALQQTDV